MPGINLSLHTAKPGNVTGSSSLQEPGIMQAPAQAACMATKWCGLETQFRTTIYGARNTPHLAWKKSVIPFIPSSAFSHLASSGSQVPLGHMPIIIQVRMIDSSSLQSWHSNPDECECHLHPCTLEPSYQTPLGMNISTMALRMKPPIPQSWVVTTQLTVDPTPFPGLLSGVPGSPRHCHLNRQSHAAPESSSFLSLAPENSAAAGRKGSRGQTPNLPQGQTLLLEEPPCTSYDLSKSEPRLQTSV